MDTISDAGLKAARKLRECQKQVQDVIALGQLELDLLVLPIICGGHAQLLGKLATGKTSAVMALARTLNLDFGLHQCSPETMPSDLVGFERYNQATRALEVRLGPALCYQVFLIDEWNRMPPKPQSALLGVMTHGKVPIGDQQCEVRRPFVVYATRNPIDTQGVYPLPEAAVDRCMIEINFPTHSYDALPTILGYANASATWEKIGAIKPLLDADDIVAIREDLKSVQLGDAWRWATALYLGCQPSPTGDERPDPRAPAGWKALREANEAVLIGPSTRALIDLVQAARGLAFLRIGADEKKASVEKKDFEDVFRSVLRHRIILRRGLPKEYLALAPELRAEHLLDQVWQKVSRRSHELPAFPEHGLR